VSLVERRRGSGPSRAWSRDGGRFRLIALIDEPAVVARILQHLKLPTDIPAARRGRAPPFLVEAAANDGPSDRPAHRPAAADDDAAVLHAHAHV
jgi:hypothetical protein